GSENVLRSLEWGLPIWRPILSLLTTYAIPSSQLPKKEFPVCKKHLTYVVLLQRMSSMVVAGEGTSLNPSFYLIRLRILQLWLSSETARSTPTSTSTIAALPIAPACRFSTLASHNIFNANHAWNAPSHTAGTTATFALPTAATSPAAATATA